MEVFYLISVILARLFYSFVHIYIRFLSSPYSISLSLFNPSEPCWECFIWIVVRLIHFSSPFSLMKFKFLLFSFFKYSIECEIIPSNQPQHPSDCMVKTKQNSLLLLLLILNHSMIIRIFSTKRMQLSCLSQNPEKEKNIVSLSPPLHHHPPSPPFLYNFNYSFSIGRKIAFSLSVYRC